ncbi:hypothetical protein BV25DRAFT_1447764 [Artomyces pyxidatus]|uniref:Uncharacterized protein n=1 Tax=Artomyces pyxidatus TaxID=48021 RepID=A0ACB8SMQ2_9AGAM|nr:hypothetical protein BV25DRAFT_1447764 [Artomyces pyxidatus]
MRTSTTLLALAAGSQVALALPFVLPPNLSPEEVKQIQSNFQHVNGIVSLRSDVVGEVAKAAESTISGALKKGALSGVGTLAGGAGIGAILDHFDKGSSSSSKRESVVGDVAKAAESTISGALKKGALSGVGTLAGGAGIGAILDHFDKSSSSPSKRENVVGDVAKAAESTISGALKKGALSGVGTLAGGAGIGAILDHFSKKNPSSKRAILEYLEARMTEEMIARKRDILVSLLEAREINELD